MKKTVHILIFINNTFLLGASLYLSSVVFAFGNEVDSIYHLITLTNMVVFVISIRTFFNKDGKNLLIASLISIVVCYIILLSNRRDILYHLIFGIPILINVFYSRNLMRQ